jgi:hypothetical protein
MKIGVYGDSFAARWAFSDIETHWWHILGKLLNAEVECFGISGTSTFFSYKHFIENHNKFDVNIFFVTNSFRYTKLTRLTNEKYEYFATFDQVDIIENRYKKDLSSADLSTLDNIRGWFLASDDEFNDVCQSLIIKDIVSKDPNVILYPSFDDSINTKTIEDLKLQLGSSAINWMDKIDEWFKMPVRLDHDEILSVIACHFTPEINVRFAEAMYNYIVKKKPIKVPKEPIEHKHDLEYYFKRK